MGRYCERYVYDEVGNLVQMLHRGSDPTSPGWARIYVCDEPSLLEPGRASNQLSSTRIGENAPDLYTYDTHGNVVSMPHLAAMRWDYRDELQAIERQVVSNGGTPETTYYVYNSVGQRVRKVTEHQSRAGRGPRRALEQIYLGGLEIERTYDRNGDAPTLERETLHVMDGRQRIALVEVRTQGKDDSPEELVRYQLANHLGSSVVEVDEKGQIISYEEYYPYGGTSYQAQNREIVSRKRFRYAGKERDEETGMYYYGARYYAPVLGRWISPDPSGIRDGVNAFQYALSNPITNLDPDGRSWRSFAEGLAIGVGTALVVTALIVAAPITLPAAAVGAIVVTGVAVTGTVVVQSVRRRDLFNRPISDDAADRQLGMAAGGLLVGGFSGPTAAGMTSASRSFVTAADSLATSADALVPATVGPSISSIAVPAVVPAAIPVSVPAAAGVTTSLGLPLVSAMMSGGDPNGASPGGQGDAETTSQGASAGDPEEASGGGSSGGEGPRTVGTYRSQGGHHVHQSASYASQNPSRSFNPNHNDAVTVDFQGSPSDVATEHGRATVVDRLLNQSARGEFSGSSTVGNVTIEASGEGTLAPTPNACFEDIKSFYSARAANAPGFQTPDDVLNLVNQSSEQLSSVGAAPVRVPSR